MTQNIVYLSKCSVFTRKECVFCCCCLEFPKSVSSNLLIMLLHVSVDHYFYFRIVVHCTNIPHFAYSFVSWLLGGFQFGAFTNKFAMKIREDVFVYIYAFMYVGQIPRSTMSGPCDRCVFTFNKIVFQTVFQSCCALLHPVYEQYMSSPSSSTSLSTLGIVNL